MAITATVGGITLKDPTSKLLRPNLLMICGAQMPSVADNRDPSALIGIGAGLMRPILSWPARSQRRRQGQWGRLLYGLWWAPGGLWGEPALIQNLSFQGLIHVGFDQILKC